MSIPASATNPRTPYITGDVQGRIIRAGESAHFITYPFGPDNAAIWKALDKVRPRFVYRLCYCSVFDECWSHVETEQVDLDPVRVGQCPAEKPPYRN